MRFPPESPHTWRCPVDGSQFDAWTRRRFGLAAGGLVASLLGLTRLDAEAKKHKKKRKRKKRKRNQAAVCGTLGAICTPGVEPICCDNRLCGHAVNETADRCCLPGGTPCTDANGFQCCTAFCIPESDQCLCKGPGADCNSSSQCCSNNCANQKCL